VTSRFGFIPFPKLNKGKYWISQLQWGISPDPDGPDWFDTFSLAPRFSAGSLEFGHFK